MACTCDERSDVAPPAARPWRASVAGTGEPEASRPANDPVAVLALSGLPRRERAARSGERSEPPARSAGVFGLAQPPDRAV